MFICYCVDWDEESGDGNLILKLQNTTSADKARAEFAEAESLPPAGELHHPRF